MNRKILIWVKLFPYYLSLYTSAKKVRNLEFNQKFEKLQYWAHKVLHVMKIDSRINGIENVPNVEGILFASNHQGSADAFVVVDALPVSSTAVSKIEGKKIPILSAWYDAIEVIYFDRNNMRDSIRMIKDVTEWLKKGRNIVIFPEGTRSKSQSMGEFKAGSLKPAMNAKAPIVPIALVNSYQILDSSKKLKPVFVNFLEPIYYDEYKEWSTVELALTIQSRIQLTIDNYSKETAI